MNFWNQNANIMINSLHWWVGVPNNLHNIMRTLAFIIFPPSLASRKKLSSISKPEFAQTLVLQRRGAIFFNRFGTYSIMSRLCDYSKFDHVGSDTDDDNDNEVDERDAHLPPSGGSSAATAATATTPIPIHSMTKKHPTIANRYIFTYENQKIYEWEQSLEVSRGCMVFIIFVFVLIICLTKGISLFVHFTHALLSFIFWNLGCNHVHRCTLLRTTAD